MQTNTETAMKNQVVELADRSDKTSWNRKLRNITKLIEEVQQLEDDIQKIHEKKLPLLDKIAEYRNEMVDTCIHPEEYLTVHEDAVKCKFCEKTIKVLNT